ncbi:MAG: 2,3-bisphosphoglycerate-independent phosphoglycerate mutase [Planctomycetaceae bacterium]|nr:2,3-bisphosphoglycerate-independent phosphoglycerate mutase [Planctomycetaceae bacterium]
MDPTVVKSLLKPQGGKIVLLVMDGLGGLPVNGRTELETARTPHLDTLAAEGICGLHQPIGTGITPGSGPSHLALFGYDPIQYEVGRGVLSALGVGFELEANDIAARGNFCTVDQNGVVTDRRAGRISTAKNEQLCKLLNQGQFAPFQFFAQPEKEHRFVLVLRGEGLSDAIADTDPQETGLAPLAPKPLNDTARDTAELFSKYIRAARDILRRQSPANMILLRGFARRPQWPSFMERYGLRAAAIAGYPMYRGLGRLLGMEILEAEADLEAEWKTLETHWAGLDFFYLHVKGTDSAGEDGDFARKVGVIEAVDALIPRILQLNPAVVVVTGDHSTPAVLKAHSWHAVPVVVWSPVCRPDRVKEFGERACMNGCLGGQFPAVELMPLALANAERLKKFGA